jgi:hypothetical protein
LDELFTGFLKKSEKIIVTKKTAIKRVCDAYSLKTQKSTIFLFFVWVLVALSKNGQK